MIELFDRITLEGHYDPSNLEASWQEEEYSVTLKEGTVTVEFNGLKINVKERIDKNYKNEIESKIRQYFLIKELKELKKIEFTGLNKEINYKDGKRSINWNIKGAFIALTGGQINSTITNAQGEILQDSHPEWKRNEEQFDILLIKYKDDKNLRRLTDSFRRAVDYDYSFTVYLYEIIDFLIKIYFGYHPPQQKIIDKKNKCPKCQRPYKENKKQNNSQAQGFFGIDIIDWKTLKETANTLPIFEGRHGGNELNLREATPQERNQCFDAARNIIYRFMLWLEKQN